MTPVTLRFSKQIVHLLILLSLISITLVYLIPATH
jgi:hypothetical protein